MSRPLAASTSRLAACTAAPLCRPAADLLAELDLPPTAGWRWLHLGPIAAQATPLAVHDPGHCCRIGGGGAQPCDICRPLPTRHDHRHHVGYRLDLFCLTARPAPPRRALPFRPVPGEPRLWPVAAFAYRDSAPDVWTGCLAGPDGRPIAEYRVAGHYWQTGADREALDRCSDLLLGTVRVGRRQRPLNPRWREIVEQSEAMKRRYPGLAWGHIGARELVSDRTLRRWRADYRRDQTAADGPGGPTLLPGGSD